MQQSDEEQVEVGQVPSGLTPQSPNYTAKEEESDGKRYTWSPTEVLNFTMLQWLPGPEAVSEHPIRPPIRMTADKQS